MGHLQASEMARLTDLDTALAWHLQSNHFPPVPLSMIEPCKAAIEAARDEEWDRDIPLPTGVTWKGHTSAPAHAIIAGHHLDAFIHVASDDPDEDDG